MMKRLLRVIAVALLALLIVLSASLRGEAAPPTPWRRTNPGGGGAFSTVGAGPSGVIIAASDLSGAYRSLDRGQTWDVIGSYRGLTTTHVGGVGFDPLDASILYLGTENGIFRSADSGATVQQVLTSGYITDVEMAVNDPMVGYAAYHPVWNSNHGRVYKSTDDGLSWQPVSTNLPAGLRILKLLVNPADADTVYLLSGEGRFATGPAVVYRSVDGGVTWTQLGAALGDVMDTTLDKGNPQIVYLTTYNVPPDDNGDLYQSTDAGDHWTQVAHRTGIIWLDARNAQVIRLIDVRYQFPWDDRNGVWQSTDGGTSWSQISQVADWDTGWTQAPWAYESSFNGEAKTLGEDLSDPDALFWATGQWVFGTFDGGSTFHNLFADEVSAGWWQSRGLDNVVMFDLAISAANSNQIYVGYFDVGCMRSLDHGASWQNCNHPDYTGGWEGNGGNTLTVATDPTRPGVVWAGQAGDVEGTHTLLRSSQAGTNWEVANAGLPGTPLAGLSVDPTSPANNRTLFVTAGGDVYASQDDGYTWSLRFDCGGCRFTAVDRFDGDLVYAGGEAGLWRSTAGGAVNSWAEVGLPEMRGTRGDEFWDRYWEGVSAIEADPVHPGGVYVAVFGAGKGLYRSQDRGNRWEKLWTGHYLRDVAVSPADPLTIYATSSSAIYSGGYAADSNGVLRSVDGGQTWEPVNEGLAWPFAGPIEIDPANPNLIFIGSPGTGIHWRSFAAYDVNGDGRVDIADVRAVAAHWHAGDRTYDLNGDGEVNVVDVIVVIFNMDIP